MSKVVRFWNNVKSQTAEPYVFEDDDAPAVEDYEMLRACWLSGQISDDHMQELMQRDPDFLEWMLDMASATEAA